MKFTLLGGQGFIGTHLAAHLRAAGHEVAIPRREQVADTSHQLGAIIYLIGLTGNFRTRPIDTVRAHTTVLADVLSRTKFESLTYVSSTRLYENHPDDTVDEESTLFMQPKADTIYNASKLAGECLCLSLNNPKIRVARLSNVVGKGMSTSLFLGSLIADARANRPITIGENQESAKDYITVHDVCWALENITINGKLPIYNVASGQQTTHRKIAEIIRQANGTQVAFADNGAKRVFPKVSIKRLVTELGFRPSKFDEALLELIQER